jgi:hypothetical protein
MVSIAEFSHIKQKPPDEPVSSEGFFQGTQTLKNIKMGVVPEY